MYFIYRYAFEKSCRRRSVWFGCPHDGGLDVAPTNGAEFRATDQEPSFNTGGVIVMHTGQKNDVGRIHALPANATGFFIGKDVMC